MVAIGGLVKKPIGFLLDMRTKRAVAIKQPPAHIICGTLIPYKFSVYVVGALKDDESPCPFLCYDTRTELWTKPPEPPNNLVLAGAYIIGAVIHCVGGWTDYPVNSNPFEKIALFNITDKAWTIKFVNCPINRGAPR
jgi:hypothetical protein